MSFAFNEDFTKYDISGLQGVCSTVSATSSSATLYTTGVSPANNSRYVIDQYKQIIAEYMPQSPEPYYNFSITHRHGGLPSAATLAGVYSFIYNSADDTPSSDVPIKWTDSTFSPADYDVINLRIWFDGLNWRGEATGYNE